MTVVASNASGPGGDGDGASWLHRTRNRRPPEGIRARTVSVCRPRGTQARIAPLRAAITGL
jgi:hypothetical protein